VPDDSRIAITFPATPDYLRLARLTTADAASRAGFDYEEIDDLRIAVSELCALISGSDAATITLDFSLEPRAVTVSGAATPGSLVENEFSRAIVAALVDEFDIAVDDGTSRFRARKEIAAR
jgi:serine/threonine-protein kinase RsbW